MAIAVAAYNAGWTEADLLEALLDPRNAAGAKVREQRQPEKHVSGRWQKAAAFVEASPPIGSRDHIGPKLQDLQAAVERQVWRGRGGASERAVLLAHMKIALRAGRLQYYASIRDVAEQAGLSATTVANVHRRLMKKGWLELVRKATGTFANEWTLRCPTPEDDRATAQLRTHSEWEGGCEGRVHVIAPDLAADAFRWAGLGHRGLGKSAQRVYDVLVDAPMPSKDIADRLGVTRRTAQYHLKRLGEHGLAIPDQMGWRRGSRSLDEVAGVLGTIGTGAAKQLDHKREREAHQEHLALPRVLRPAVPVRRRVS